MEHFYYNISDDPFPARVSSPKLIEIQMYNIFNLACYVRSKFNFLNAEKALGTRDLYRRIRPSTIVSSILSCVCSTDYLFMNTIRVIYLYIVYKCSRMKILACATEFAQNKQLN